MKFQVVLSSVGISGDKTTAKVAAKQNKPDGLTIIHPKRSASALANLKLDGFMRC